jgi:Zn-dependent protease with chaperone function
MSEMTATRKGLSWRAATITGLAVALWLLAAWLLWRSTVPADLSLPDLDPRRYFTAEELDKTARYERFIRIDIVLSTLATIVALWAFSRRAPQFARNTGLGPIGAGMIVGMIVLILLWAVDLPFSIALRWWADRHDLTHGSWADWLFEPWAVLGLSVAFVMLQIAIIMGFARRFPRYWWLPVTPIFLALAFAFSVALPYVDAGRVHAPRRADVREAYAALERQEGTDVPLDEEKVSDLTTQANAMVEGLGPTMRVVIWDTLLDGRFSPGEIRFVLAHELGHVKHEHVYKGFGWAILFAFPITFLLAWLTRRRGGMGDPGVLPYGFLVLTVLGILVTPIGNVISRRVEAEADWQALQTTKDPASGQGLFQEFTRTSLQQPEPPTWAYIYFDTHPTAIQRIAMMEAWKTRSR